MLKALGNFLAENADTMLVSVADVKGSTPRETDAWMLVSAGGQIGTVGGGQLEYLAIDHARALLSNKTGKLTLDIPLGSEIGQCCGGRVTLNFQKLDARLASHIRDRVRKEADQRPNIYVFGAGHTGKALLSALSLLPVKTTVIETRASELAGLPEGVEKRLEAMPESIVKDIPSGSALVILTHDHTLDFLIAGEALQRNDLAYIGMIGSATKKATFKNWLKREIGDAADFQNLTLPIGGKTKDKRPQVIAAFTAAEVMTAILEWHSELYRQPYEAEK